VKANATDVPPPAPAPASASAEAVTALYQAHALGLIRLAVVMLGDRPAAEDVVQEAFCGLYRRWYALSDTGKALSYVRSSVINGCRTVLRRRNSAPAALAGDPPVESAEVTALVSEEHQQVLTAIRRLPDRQREALVLRFYLDLNEEEIAASMRPPIRCRRTACRRCGCLLLAAGGTGVRPARGGPVQGGPGGGGSAREGPGGRGG
jgi:RNA polymerase sigma factor (sigma-70 family)